MKKLFDYRVQLRLAWLLMVLATIVYAVEMSHQAVLRYDTFKATAFDLGNMDQVIWNTIHGRLFQFTNQAIDWYGPPTRLAVHFEPILLPLSLLYVFHADPRILLIFQTLVLAAGALPVFLLARKYLAPWPFLAALFAVAYLLAPPLLGENIFDFHPVALATPLLLYAFLALTYRRYVWFLIACILAAACKEDVPLTIAILGIVVIWRYKLPRLGATLIVGGLLWAGLAFLVIIPHFYPGAQHNNFWYRYEALGTTPSAAIVNILLHPWVLFTTYLAMERFYYLAGLFRSGSFLCFLAPEWLLPALFSIVENVLSTDTLVYSGVYHYNASIIPFVMISAILGTRRFLALWVRWRGEPIAEVELLPGVSLAQPTLPASFALLAKRLVAIPGVPSLLALGKRGVLWLKAWFLRLFHPNWWQGHWQRFNARMIPLAKQIPVFRLQWIIVFWVVLMIAVDLVVTAPVLNIWADHDPGTHEQHIQQLLNMIPPDASVSAGDNLNPHLSERQQLAIFPSISGTIGGKQYTVDYIIVDLNAVFPQDRAQTVKELNFLASSGQFRLLARAEGVILLVRRGR